MTKRVRPKLSLTTVHAHQRQICKQQLKHALAVFIPASNRALVLLLYTAMGLQTDNTRHRVAAHTHIEHTGGPNYRLRVEPRLLSCYLLAADYSNRRAVIDGTTVHGAPIKTSHIKFSSQLHEIKNYYFTGHLLISKFAI